LSFSHKFCKEQGETHVARLQRQVTLPRQNTFTAALILEEGEKIKLKIREEGKKIKKGKGGKETRNISHPRVPVAALFAQERRVWPRASPPAHTPHSPFVRIGDNSFLSTRIYFIFLLFVSPSSILGLEMPHWRRERSRIRRASPAPPALLIRRPLPLLNRSLARTLKKQIKQKKETNKNQQ